MIDREGHVGAAAKGRRGRGRVVAVVIAVVVVVDAGVGGGVGGGVHSSALANIMTV